MTTKTEQQIRDDNQIRTTVELANWIVQHLKMRYRVAFYCDGYGAEWLYAHADGSLKSDGSVDLINAIAEYGSTPTYISKNEGASIFKELLSKDSINKDDFIEINLFGRRYVFATWVDWWLLRGFEHHI